MSISVDELLYETFTLKLEKDTRFNYSSIPLENRIMFLRSAESKLIKKYYGENNIYKLGFEAFKKRIDDLQVIVTRSEKVSLRRDTASRYFKYIGDISTITSYMFYIQSYITASKGNCKNRIINNVLIESGDLDTNIKSEYNSPSFEWQEQLITLGNNKLEIYTDGSYKPEYLYLDYLRYPPKIDKEGYIDFNGVQSTNQDSILPEYLKNDLIDLTCELVAMSQENQIQTNFSKERITNNE